MKLADVTRGTESAVEATLFVINENVVPRADLDVYIDRVHVVTGDFENPGNIDPAPSYRFELDVPNRPLELRAESSEAELVTTIEPIPMRTFMLTYVRVHDPEGYEFRLDVHDGPFGGFD